VAPQKRKALWTEKKSTHELKAIRGPVSHFCHPGFNEEKLVSLAIRSIRAEMVGRPNEYEILVVDNASTDRTADVALEHGARVVEELKRGIVTARHAGYRHARYDLLANIDADNTIPSGWLDKALAAMDPATVVVTGPLVYPEFSRLLQIFTRVFYFFGRLSHHAVGTMVQGGNFIVRKSALDAVGGYNTEIAFFGEDTDFAVRIARVGNVKLVPKMWVYSSARRFQVEGVVLTTWRYILNYLTVTFLGKPVTTEYQNIRP
jgi:glycosyltransferase involved in cell wall biosynthesis